MECTKKSTIDTDDFVDTMESSASIPICVLVGETKICTLLGTVKVSLEVE